MDAIGGYFSLELPLHEEYHKNAIKLNTGRNCLEYILRCRHYTRVYIPYYTCIAVLEPFSKLGIQYAFYHVNSNLEIVEDITLASNEALLYTNYYGLKQRYVKELAERYGANLVVDNTQAFYADPIKGIDTFYTCRKFFGVPDGAYLYCDAKMDEEFEQDYSFERTAHLIKRLDLSAENGYAFFRKSEEGLDNQPIKKMSKLTQHIMKSIDYASVKHCRRGNYKLLNNALSSSNQFAFDLDEDAVPMVYPYFSLKEDLRKKLIECKVFVATYWPNVLEWVHKTDFEYNLVTQMQPLPIDQRYHESEMEKIIDIISNV